MQEESLKIDNRYSIIRPLGGGLSGEVFAVADDDGEKALKFLKKVQFNVSKDEALQSFKNEFSILSELNHPHIARILDFGFDTRQEKYFFTTELVCGRDFFAATAESSFDEIEMLAVEVLRALNYLHSRGIFHLDIKPQNVLVGEEGGVKKAKLIDFGLAGFANPRKKVGTPAYMAPEVILGGTLDGRTDLYSFGVLLYKVLTRQNPFASKNARESLERHRTLIPQAPSEVSPLVPKFWDRIVLRLLAKNPTDRYPEASAVIRDINFLNNKNHDVETMDTRLSYLPEKGVLIARDKQEKVFHDMFKSIFTEHQSLLARLLIISGKTGTGKSRLLSEFKYHSQLSNVPVYGWSSFSREKKTPPFCLVIDTTDQVPVQEVNRLLQKHAHDEILLLWAVEECPAQLAQCQIIKLEHFNKLELAEYISMVTGLSSPPQKLIDGLHKRTEGNPLFVTELLKTMLASNMLLNASGRWASNTFQDIDINFEKIQIPQTLLGLLNKRYQALAVDEQTLLEWLTIFNRPLSVDEFKELTAFQNVEAELLKLTSLGLVERTSREKHYFFSNLLMRDAILADMTADKMGRMHNDAALFVKKNNGDHDDYLYHMGRGTNHSLAVDALLKLSETQTQNDQFLQAIESVSMAWKRAQNLDLALQIRVETRLAECFILARDYKNAVHHYQHLSDIHETDPVLKNLPYVFQIQEKLGDLFVKLDQLDRARELFEKALLSLKNQKERTVERMVIENHLASIHMREGRLDEAESIFERNQALWNGFDLANQQKVTNNKLAQVKSMKKDYAGAICQILSDIAFYEKIQDSYLLTKTYHFLGDLYYSQMLNAGGSERVGLKEEALKAFFKCTEISKKIQAHDLMLRSYNGMANLYYVEKEYKSSLEYYERALALARTQEEFQSASAIATNMGNIFKLLKNYADAYSHFVYAINTLESLNPKNYYTWLYLFNAHVELSETFRDTGDAVQALEHLNIAEGIIQKNPSLEAYRFWIHLETAKTELKNNNRVAAEESLARAETLALQPHELEELSKFKASLIGQENKADMKPEEEVMNSVTKYETILQINKFINSEHNPELLLKMVLNYALELSGAETGMVLLINEAGDFDIKATVNTPNVNSLSNFSNSVARQVLNTGKEAIIADALADDRFTSSQSIVLSEMKSVLCLPIRSKNRTIGVFYLDNRFKTDAFLNADIKVLNAFCDQVGIALENARLISGYEGIKKKLEEQLEKTSEELTHVKERLDIEISAYLTKYSYDNIISKSEAMGEIFKLLDKITETNLSVYLFGASGTGKELIARALHYNNKARSQKRFVAINCGAIPANLIESELFGYKAGAFTGAVKDKKGLFEEAHGGTIFLDEIGELDLSLQVKLLRVLQEGEVRKIGDTHSVKVDVRVVCASHKDIAKMVSEQKFREDLFYRLCQITVAIPPLADRREDIPVLCEHFIEKYRTENKMDASIKASPEFMKALLAHNWPGNIRELENLISVACALREGGHLTLASIPPTHALFKNKADSNVAYLSKTLKQIANPEKEINIDEKNIYNPGRAWASYEALVIAACFKLNDFKKSSTADMLDISASTFYKKIKDYDLDNPSNTLFAENFWYNPKLTLKDYVPLVFKASLTYCDEHPYAAIKLLDVSQGYFYKILKQIKDGEKDTGTGAR
ncbi:sigma 54-interacting transcriptional regulator [bacterium]|nr:sigma 54-interacting transcriptional regulator [bacterium]